jgi:hypothetical protein
MRRGDLLFLLHTQSIPELILATHHLSLLNVEVNFSSQTSLICYPTNSSTTSTHKKAGKS